MDKLNKSRFYIPFLSKQTPNIIGNGHYIKYPISLFMQVLINKLLVFIGLIIFNKPIIALVT